VSRNWNVLVTLICGLLNSSPRGEKPVTVMKLSPASRGFGERSGRPTLWLTLAARFS
jgi:hypothetical protein